MALPRKLPESVKVLGKTKTKSGRLDYTFSVPCIKCGRIRSVRRRQHAIAMSKKPCKKCSNIANHPQETINGIRSSHFKKFEIGAEQRSKTWKITIQQAAEILKQQNNKCAISGLDIIACGPFEKITASLDRIDNKIGYELDNVQWAHKEINMMRGKLSVKRFIELCKSVAENANRVKW